MESQRVEPDGLVRVGHRRCDHELSIDSANVDGGLELKEFHVLQVIVIRYPD